MEELSQKRVVLVLEEATAPQGRWQAELMQHFEVRRVLSVIGSQRALGRSPISAAVVNVSIPETRAASLIRLLREQPNLEQVPVIVLAHAPLEPVTRAVAGLTQVEVLDATRAHLLLRSRITGCLATPWREERPKREAGRPGGAGLAAAPSQDDKHRRLQERFAKHSAERSQRALALCNDLRAPNLTPERRRGLLDDVKDLLNMMKGEATLLRLRDVAELLASAESILARIDDMRRSVSVPRGVVGLLSDLTALNSTPGALQAFDVELHRSRLNAREEPDRSPLKLRNQGS
jgi:hypothetical protein